VRFKVINGTLIAGDEEALKAIASIPDHGDIDLVVSKKQRTKRQNNSLHLYLEMLADALNERGLDMKKVLKEEVDIPWNKDLAKEFLWTPLQLAVLGVESTTKPDTTGYSKVYDVLNRHIAEKFGVRVLWPSYLDIAEAK
jgi:hypothetical protein